MTQELKFCIKRMPPVKNANLEVIQEPLWCVSMQDSMIFWNKDYTVCLSMVQEVLRRIECNPASSSTGAKRRLIDMILFCVSIVLTTITILSWSLLPALYFLPFCAAILISTARHLILNDYYN